MESDKAQLRNTAICTFEFELVLGGGGGKSLGQRKEEVGGVEDEKILE